MSQKSGFKLGKDFIPNFVKGNVCMKVGLEKSAKERIVTTAVYNLDYLVAALQAIKEKMPPASWVQLRFVKQDDKLIALIKAWSDDTDAMYPAPKDQYIGLAPVAKHNEKKGFDVWSEYQSVTEYMPVFAPADVAILPCHAGIAASEEELIESLITIE